MDAQNKKMMMVGGIIAALLIVGVGIKLLTTAPKSNDQGNGNMLPEVEVLPTVDSSVVVTLKPLDKGKEVEVSVKNAPKGTTAIEYEMSYDAVVDGNKVPKGAIGTIDEIVGNSVTRKITLGTCSSGTCKYDLGVESVKLTLRFTGLYGAQIFEKEFSIK